jgi:hypothetical protein
VTKTKQLEAAGYKPLKTIHIALIVRKGGAK